MPADLALKPLSPPKRRLMGPGPSDVSPRVLQAMATPLVGHLDPAFLQIMDEIRAMLRAVMRTANELTFALSATGSAGMEACVVNLIEPGDEIVIGVNGVFGTRMCDVAERAGARVHRVEAPWGEIITPEAIAGALDHCRPKAVAVVHAETSTGVRTPLEEIGGLARQAGALFLVDAVTSLAGIDLRVDEWGIDALYSGTQKCLSCPPGLSPVTFSVRAVEAMSRRRSKCQSWYLDSALLRSYWGQERAYHHTAPITMNYALHEALRIVLEEGLDARFARHRRVHERLRDALEAMGFSFLVAPEHRLPQLNAVRVPEGIDEAAARRRLLEEFGIEIGGGLGALRGKIWRIGLMGESATGEHVDSLLDALRRVL